MKIQVNDKEVIFPSSLSEFTLGQRISFHHEHGIQLQEMLEAVMKMDDNDPMKEIELHELRLETAFRTFAFFAGTSVEAIKESKFIEDVLNVYDACLTLLFQDESQIEFQETIIWNGEEWKLQPPELKNGSKMKFGEFIDAKQLVKDMVELGNGKWEYMLPLCAIYLRRPDEEYQEQFLYDGSDRLKLMESLPMDIALQVGFFLSSTMNFYVNTLTSSGSHESNPAGSTRENTLTVTAG